MNAVHDTSKGIPLIMSNAEERKVEDLANTIPICCQSNEACFSVLPECSMDFLT